MKRVKRTLLVLVLGFTTLLLRTAPSSAGVHCSPSPSGCAQPELGNCDPSTYTFVPTGSGSDCCCLDFDGDGCRHEVKCDWLTGVWTAWCIIGMYQGTPVWGTLTSPTCESVYDCRSSNVRCGSSIGDPNCLYEGHDPGEGHVLCDETPY